MQERPKPLLTVQPEPSQILIGDTVTLTCDIQGEGWTYTWQCGGREQASMEKEFNITAVSTQKCRCCVKRQSDTSEWSEEVTLTVLYKPKVSVKPQSSVFTGDTVTLSCDVGQSTGRTIFWFKDFERIKASDDVEIRSNVSMSDGGQYRCSAQKGKYFTTQSQRLVLTVSERPKPVLRVDPDEHVFRGQTVILTCDIQETDVSSWSYIWSKDDSEIDVSQSQEYRISSVNESHTGRYSCTGRETGGSRSSHTSDTVTLTLSDKPKVSVKPQSSVFTGDTVTLSCDVGQPTGRTIFWIKDFKRIKASDDVEIRSNVSISDGGEYRCSAQKGKYFTVQNRRVVLTVSVSTSIKNSQFNFQTCEVCPAIITERPKPVLRVDPDEHVIRGQTVILTCDIQETDVSIWSYIWSKDDSQIDVSQSQEYRISSVNESHTGRYSCTGRETGGSRSSHTSDTVTLTLSDKPRVSVKPQSSVFTGDTVTLSCDVGQSTGRTIIWIKNSMRIETVDQTITLRDVRVSDGGQYTCTVGGKTTASKPAVLTVRGKCCFYSAI
ncbi:obscurin-like [Carassius gibelio]|uniref:obscurin-like n=1 Tax=Carassius gibelio TaxID=101364 RepID=UPI0022790111|nr:obscurin-like [Carassius gibelio]